MVSPKCRKQCFCWNRHGQICNSGLVKPVTPTDCNRANSSANRLSKTWFKKKGEKKKKPEPDTLVKLRNGNLMPAETVVSYVVGAWCKLVVPSPFSGSGWISPSSCCRFGEGGGVCFLICWVKCYGKHCFNQVTFFTFSEFGFIKVSIFKKKIILFLLVFFFPSHYRTGNASSICSTLAGQHFVLSVYNSTQNVSTSHSFHLIGILEAPCPAGYLSFLDTWVLYALGFHQSVFFT